MFHRIVRPAIVTIATVFAMIAAPTAALAQTSHSIAEALESLEISTYFTVVGTIVDSKGQGLYLIEDDSGRMPVVIKDHLVREHGDINRQDRVQIWGRFEEKKLDNDVRGMMVSKLHRLPATSGASGANNPGADTSAPVIIETTAPAPAAPSESQVMRPMASEDFKQRARAELQAYRQAEKDAVEAGQVYARAAREAGSDGQVDEAVIEALQQAEARVVETRGRIPALMNEARAAGVDESIVHMIGMEAGIR